MWVDAILFAAQHHTRTDDGSGVILSMLVCLVFLVVLIARAGAIRRARAETVRIAIPISYWEQLHRNPGDAVARTALRRAIREMLERKLLGPKRIDEDVLTGKVILRRSRLQYESHVEPYVGDGRHGFVVTVPSHGFGVRITCPRVVPAEVVGAPWDDLLENLCKIDRTIIVGLGSRSKPLTYVPDHGPHPLLWVEFLGERPKEYAVTEALSLEAASNQAPPGHTEVMP